MHFDCPPLLGSVHDAPSSKIIVLFSSSDIRQRVYNKIDKERENDSWLVLIYSIHNLKTQIPQEKNLFIYLTLLKNHFDTYAHGQ